jgi:phage tail-like protein
LKGRAGGGSIDDVGKARRPPVDLRVRLTVAARSLTVAFRECSGLESETQLVEYRDGNDPTGGVRKLAGATTWSNIVLRRGLDTSLDLWTWRESVLAEGVAKAQANGRIEFLSAAGRAVATFEFERGWPIRYAVSSVAGETGAAVEELELSVERFDRV